jgi:uncharacterized membrane protein YqjE
MYCRWDVLWADNLLWKVGLDFVWIVVYLSGLTTRVVGPKARWMRFVGVLYSALFCLGVIACSLLLYHVNVSRSTYLLRHTGNKPIDRFVAVVD